MTAMLVVTTLGLTACGQVDDPTQAAEQFAEQLSSDQLEALDGASLAKGSMEPESLAEATAALAAYPATVSLDSVVEDDADELTATADYTVTWNLSDGTETEDAAEASDAPEESDTTSEDQWSYTTQATLVWDDEAEAWEPQLAAETLVPGLAEGGRVDVAVAPAQRGKILDTQDVPLATERPVQRIGIDKTHLLNELAVDGEEPTDDEVSEAAAESATALAEALDLDTDTFIDRVQAAGDRAWVEFIVLRDDDETDIPSDQITEIPGAVAREDTMVLGPTATFARSLLGSYGEPSAEQVENSDGEMTAGTPTGLSGLQHTYNDELSGINGLEITVDNADVSTEDLPDSDPVEFSRESEDGTAITTTLDTRIQELAEETIGDSDVLAGLVAIRPSDGHILAAADGPEDTSWPLAMQGSYAPGSTFKIVTALAMLRNGMDAESTVECPETINVGGTEISNFDGYPSEHLGEITLADAIAQSCNTSFVGQFEDISPQQEHDAATALGLVEDPIVGYDGAFLGSVPTDVEGTQHAAGLFGQGLVQTSPLGMATVAASVSAGETVSPVLVSDPSVDPTENENLPGNTPLTEDEAAQLRELMSGPVETGTVPILQDVPGVPVLAKTGTAEYVSEGEDLAHTWIMALHGDLAVSLFFHEGFAGAQTNGPVLKEFITELEEIMPSES
ncbi:penicillin-binding transpeptidase domain-containing protein [Yaniella sp.]|uniref:penicillin-binding transpeptidase domain-containing protein n=1 Tax=Yaniella sp. TaxID=2773929 RepID=UPI0026480E64|nr:penicillin-binding transpeptidase domain-containing protein [Yaniella sp.]MDN6358637.1 penicillin-binding protein [Yaniella sp.]